ncbi:MAG: DNA photolyase [Deltaproteobacteria bacterium]|jgi:spore photoproduct lyase|nr:DNA photolyase [Deltaproteobacteria bacterium]MBQ32510.1 DNA photolyase [Deltaproteobacteria bacterium]
MINTIYIEDEVSNHPRVVEMTQRFPSAARVPCERYTAVFNLKGQNFRLQKHNPSLMLARKFDNFMLATPQGYGIGGLHNYYFSHMLNCIYDCRYCFLQGMYRSAHYVVFVNYEDFFGAMDEKLVLHPQENVWFFSGYDCDSLALEPVTGFTALLFPFLESRPRAMMELRTKSTHIQPLLGRDSLPNVIVAFSFTPAEISSQFEHKVPSVAKRVDAMAKLAAGGWQLGLRFDPLIYEEDFESHYQKLFRQIFERVDSCAVHSVTIGPFRMPRGFFRNMVRLYPEEALLAGTFRNRDGVVSYNADREAAMLNFCIRQLKEYVAPEIIYSCAPHSRPNLAGDSSDGLSVAI